MSLSVVEIREVMQAAEAHATALFAPELIAADLEPRAYIVAGQPAGIPVGRHTEAFTSVSSDLVAQAELERAGRWRGRAPAVAFNAEILQRVRSAREAFRWVRGLLAHELAHVMEWIDSPLLRAHNITAETVAAVRQKWSCISTSESPIDLSAPTWHDGHDARWCRAAMALAWRDARQFGGIELLDNCAPYGFSVFHLWHSLKRDRLDLPAETPLQVRLATPPPKAFTLRWEKEVQNWNRSHPQPQEKEANVNS